MTQSLNRTSEIIRGFLTHFLQRLPLLKRPQRILFLVFLIVIQTKLLWGFWKSIDLPLWDGSLYYHYGWAVANQHILPPLDWSPFYSIYYAVFVILLKSFGPLVIYFFQRVITIYLVLFVEYLLFTAAFSPFLAFLLTLCSILIRTGTENSYVVHSFVVIPLLLSFFFALPGRRNTSLILLFLFLTYLVRPDYCIAFLVALVIFLIESVGKVRREGKSRLFDVGLLILISLLFLFLITNGSFGTRRSLDAFGQHYAVGYLERNPSWGKDPWLFWREPVFLVFGNIDSVGEAVKNNPIEFLSHIFWNLYIFYREFLKLLTPYVFPQTGSYLISFLLVFGLFSGAAMIYRGICKRKDLRLNALIFPMIGFGSVFTVITSALLIRPRIVHMYALIPVLLIFAGFGLNTSFQRFFENKWSSWIGTILVTLYLLYALPMPYNFYQQRATYHFVKAIDKYEDGASFSVVASSGSAYCWYLTDPKPCSEVFLYENLGKGEEIRQYLVLNNTKFIILSPGLLKNFPQETSQYFSKLVEDPQDFGWDFIEEYKGYQFFMRLE